MRSIVCPAARRRDAGGARTCAAAPRPTDRPVATDPSGNSGQRSDEFLRPADRCLRTWRSRWRATPRIARRRSGASSRGPFERHARGAAGAGAGGAPRPGPRARAIASRSADRGRSSSGPVRLESIELGASDRIRSGARKAVQTLAIIRLREPARTSPARPVRLAPDARPSRNGSADPRRQHRLRPDRVSAFAYRRSILGNARDAGPLLSHLRSIRPHRFVGATAIVDPSTRASQRRTHLRCVHRDARRDSRRACCRPLCPKCRRRGRDRQRVSRTPPASPPVAARATDSEALAAGGGDRSVR